MLVIIVKNKVDQAGINEYIEVSKKFAADMHNVDGCIDAKVLIDENKMVVNYELWKDEEAYKKYDGSVFIKYKQELKKYFMGNTTEKYTVLE